MSRLRTALLLAAGAALAACADDAPRADAARPARVALALDSATLASLGDSARVTARVLDAGRRRFAGAAVRGSLSAAAMARDREGVYRAVANGRAVVRAEVDVGETGVAPGGYWARPVADSVVLEVRQRPARPALVPVDTALRALGERRQRVARVTDARGHALLDGPP
ncbi:hypothetical protein, partial [Roseisolibacter sp. H3M3-2]|uniref:hypothetical protein n=1 Tax=Roseisolibacter sp. H3M3-2 TaxID=3031323 RepID=UPI0023D9EB37